MDMAQLGADCLCQEYMCFERSECTPCLLFFSFECPPDKIIVFVEVETLSYMESREVSKFR